MKDNLIDCDGVALGELVRKKAVQPTELLEITVERIEKINPKLNAIIHKMYDQAWETAVKWNNAVQKGNAGGSFFAVFPSS